MKDTVAMRETHVYENAIQEVSCNDNELLHTFNVQQQHVFKT